MMLLIKPYGYYNNNINKERKKKEEEDDEDEEEQLTDISVPISHKLRNDSKKNSTSIQIYL